MSDVDFEQLADHIVDKLVELSPATTGEDEAAKAAVLKLLRPLREAFDPNWTVPKAGYPVNKPGYDALWGWFGLGRASYLTMPRVLMHEMPDEWQGRMAALLKEYDAIFHSWPDGMGTQVMVTMHGRIVKTPGWILSYRHPDRDEINRLRGGEDKAA